MVKEIEQYYAILRKSYDAQAEYIKEIRSIKHDMQAHMIVLQYYLEEEKYDKAKAYLQEMCSTQQTIKRLQIDTGNNMVNAILAERWKQSDASIEVACSGELPKELSISEFDLCTIFSNLFSNAVEACEKLTKQKKEIRIELQQMEKTWTIVMKNPIEWAIDKEILGKGSSKEDKKEHGFGISNVRRTVKKNDGTIDFIITDSTFSAKISLPFISKSQ